MEPTGGTRSRSKEQATQAKPNARCAGHRRGCYVSDTSVTGSGVSWMPVPLWGGRIHRPRCAQGRELPIRSSADADESPEPPVLVCSLVCVALGFSAAAVVLPPGPTVPGVPGSAWPARPPSVVLVKDSTIPAAVDVQGAAAFPLKDIKAGQVAKGYTVFASSRGPEPFSAEILGVMHGYLGPGEDLIIARLVGEQIERTGVISGMSGSPVYIDGKLVGAVGYRFGQFTKDAIAGITPIERMMTGAPLPLAVGATSAGKRSMADTPWGRAEPIAIPISVSGLAPGVAEGFASILAERGYGPLMAAGGSSSSSTPSRPAQRFFAAGPIAGLMVDGDIQMAGIGTVTWVKGDRFLAFGHPFMGTGISTMPVSNAEIVTTVASDAGSWKMGQATGPVGRLTDDRLHAIAGTMGERPRTIPVTLTVDLPSPRKGQDATTNLHFEVMDHPTDTPLFSAIAIANALQGRVSAENGGTFDVIVDATVTTGDRVQLAARLADDTTNPAVPAALAVLAGVSALTESDFVDVKLASLNVTVRGRPEVELSRIVSAAVVSSAKAGESVAVAVGLLPWRAALREERVSFRVPRGLAPGAYAVVVASAGAAGRVEREGGLVALPRSYADQLAQVKDQAQPGSVSVYIVRDEVSPRLEGAPLPGLPASLAELTGGTGGLYGGGGFEARASRVSRVVLGGAVIVGEAMARLIVTE